jgi:hypothetical protein
MGLAAFTAERHKCPAHVACLRPTAVSKISLRHRCVQTWKAESTRLASKKLRRLSGSRPDHTLGHERPNCSARAMSASTPLATGSLHLDNRRAEPSTATPPSGRRGSRILESRHLGSTLTRSAHVDLRRNMAVGLKVLDPKWTIRETDIPARRLRRRSSAGQSKQFSAIGLYH